MTDRVIDISEAAARLSVRYKQLVIEPEEGSATLVPLADLAVLIASHPRIRYTQAVLAGIAEHKGVFIACGRDHMPKAMLLPVEGHYVQAERFAKQAQASLPTRKRLWRDIVRCKVKAQARLLIHLHGDEGGVAALVGHVRSGDPDNVEARAARRYWPLLFDDRSFRRRREASDQNRLLNWGYAVLRAMVSRAICAAGLHPSFGLHHRNRYDAFQLADDLMEPFRPLVDRAVVDWVREWGRDTPLDPGTKRHLLQALTARYVAQDESRTLFNWLTLTSQSLAQVLTAERKDLLLPEIQYAPPKKRPVGVSSDVGLRDVRSAG